MDAILMLPWVQELLKRLLIVFIVCVLIFLFGAYGALITRQFEFKKLALFMREYVLPYSLAYATMHITVNLLIMSNAELFGAEEIINVTVTYAIYSVMLLTLISKLAEQLRVFLPGLEKTITAAKSVLARAGQRWTQVVHNESRRDYGGDEPGGD